jgi:glycine/D-amino acid oxidase-like deaminating enzyme
MTYDFIIIGGGIAGISAAARIAPLGKTLVLEAETALAYHASGRSAALFEPFYGAPSVNDLTRAGEDYFRTAHGGVLSKRGIMMVARPDEEADLAVEAAGFHMDMITVADAVNIIPILDAAKLSQAAISYNAEDIDTDLLIQNFARDARANGADIRTKAPVTAITKTATGWTLTAGDTEVETKTLINAAGAWADEIATFAGINPIGLTPFRRSMARIPAPNDLDLSAWPMLFGIGENWYAKPDAGQLIVSPADEDATTPHDAYADDLTLAEGIDRFSQVVTTEVTRITANWAGLRTFAPDRTLVIGPDAADSSFFWLAGQGGYGFQTSPGASQLVADLIAGRASELPQSTVDALSPERFA